jgi:hypothetical protein
VVPLLEQCALLQRGHRRLADQWASFGSSLDGLQWQRLKCVPVCLLRGRYHALDSQLALHQEANLCVLLRE